jgi:hypothetical protein
MINKKLGRGESSIIVMKDNRSSAAFSALFIADRSLFIKFANYSQFLIIIG